MRALIVDDDIYSIQGLNKGVNWEKCGIDEVYTASSASAARKILQDQDMDVIVCDIEMPSENGIELLKWIREKWPDRLVMFYSCHADFLYAQIAVKMNVFDYVLKPAPYSEIEEALKKAVDHVKEYRKENHYDQRKDKAIREKFVQALVNGTIPGTENEIRKMQDRLGIEMTDQKGIYLILHDIRSMGELLEKWNRIDLEFSFKNIACEVYQMDLVTEILNLSVSKNRYLTILFCKEELKQEDILSKCRHMNQAFMRLTGKGMNCFVSERVCLQEIEAESRELKEVMRKEGRIEQAVECAHELTLHKEKEYISEKDERECYNALLKKQPDILQAQTERWNNILYSENNCSYYDLEKIFQKYMKIISSVFEIKNEVLTELTRNAEYQQYMEQALWGPYSLIKFIQYTNEKTIELLTNGGKEEKTINSIKEYINQHMDEEISRQDVAKLFFLNEDYLSRLFKKEEGISLTQYITNKKIARAKELLELPDVSVTTVAEKIGISNFAYFSRVFKKETGMTPSEYRKMSQKSTSRETDI